jgi:circadian clock protein KaiB
MPDETPTALGTALVEPRQDYGFRLYVTGATPSSTRAIANLKTLCERHLKGRYVLEVIDLYRDAGPERIQAVPTVVRWTPTPERRMVGDLSDSQRVLKELDLKG